MPQKMLPVKAAAAKMRPPAERSGDSSSSATQAKTATVQASRKRRPTTVRNRAAGAEGIVDETVSRPGQNSDLATVQCQAV